MERFLIWAHRGLPALRMRGTSSATDGSASSNPADLPRRSAPARDSPETSAAWATDASPTPPPHAVRRTDTESSVDGGLPLRPGNLARLLQTDALQRRLPNAMNGKPSRWQQWLRQPQTTKVHSCLFQVHFRIGSIVAAYVTVVTLTGSVVVFRNQLAEWGPMLWLVRLHTNLLAGSTGRIVNGIGGVCLTLLCLTGAIIWWPGIKYWRRSLEVNWRANFPRLNWDLHSALGFWFLPMLLLWGLSGTYFDRGALGRSGFSARPSCVDRNVHLLSKGNF